MNWIVKARSILTGFWLIGLSLLLLCSPAFASDHQDGPKVIADPTTDITDLFAFRSPENEDHLVLILNTFPLAGESTWFSDALDYSFVLRPASIATSESTPQFEISDPEYRITCHFGEPYKRSYFPWIRGDQSLVQLGRCLTSDGEVISVRTHNESGSESGGIRAFAGLRADSFYLNVPDLKKGKVGPVTGSENSLKGRNVLGLVMEIDLDQVFGTDHGSLYAFIGEIYSSGRYPVRLDRQGRSEITNLTLSLKRPEQVDVRDLYNMEDTYDLSEDYVQNYRDRFLQNLKLYDQLDGQQNWSEEEHRALVDLLVEDYLVIDVDQPCGETPFLDIERALLTDQSYTTCGGRMPDEDTVDALLTLYINADQGDRIGDGVDRPSRPATQTFPYLAKPFLSQDTSETAQADQ